MIRRCAAAFTAVLAVGTTGIAAAPTAIAAPRPLAVVIHVTTKPILNLDGRPESSARTQLVAIAEALDTWRSPDAGLPLSLAVSPVLCDELETLATPEARRVLSTMRALARRADVLSAPYSEVDLSYLDREAEVRDEIQRGRATLRECLERAPIDVLLPHGFDLDDQAVDVARSLGIDTALSNRAGAPVRSDPTDEHGAITLVPQTNAADLGTGRLQGALLVPADDPSWASTIATASSAGEVEAVTIGRLAQGAPRVFVDFPDPETPDDAVRRAIVRARRAVQSFENFTLGDNPLRRRFRIGHARALATASAVWSDEKRDGKKVSEEASIRSSEALLDAVQDEFHSVTTPGGSFIFSARRGRVPVTVSNGAKYPVKIRVKVSSPKLDFPDGTSKVVTVEPPGLPVEFSAIARSTGTFPTIVRLTSPDRTVVFDTAELSVRSTAVNFSALVLTIGGAFFLIAWLVRRRGRKRATQ